MHNVQQLIRQQSNQIVLGKRIIPVSVSSQNARQTIQVSLQYFVRFFLTIYFQKI